jgi:hypothetical protein
MANSKEREKRRASRLRKNEALKKASMELAELIEEDVPDELPVEVEQKDYGMAEPMMEMAMPVTSFQELDALKAAQEQADIVREVTYEVQDLVRNILYTPDMSPKQKTSAMKAVADEFGNRVQSEVSDEMSEKSLDMDVLEIDALIAKDNRRVSVIEKLTDWVDKKKLTYRAEQALSDDQFALTYEEDGKKVRKYPIHDKAHVRNALARAAQMIKQGGKAAEDARKALPKIHSAAKKMGIGSMEKDRSSVMVEKDATGGWRAVMWPSNNFKDWDGEIISEKAHLEYVEWVNKNMDVAPVFLSWHKGGTRREAQADFVGYENGFLLMSAPLTQKEAAGLLRAQALTDVGMSHGSMVFERKGNVIEKYRMVEVSDLPLENAANPFTDFETLTKEVEMDTKQYLASVLGSDELAEKFLAKTQEKQDALRKAGVEEKEVVAETTPEDKTEAKPEDALKIEDVIARVSKELGMEELSEQFAKLQEAAEKVVVLESVVKELSKNRDEELAEMIQPKISSKLSWMNNRPSQKSETVLKDNEEDEKLKKAKPEVGWLSEITGTTPLQ